MQKAICFILAIAFTACGIQAQDTLKKPQPNRIYFKPLDRFNRDSVPSKARNEIHINISPYVFYAMGAISQRPKFGIGYKRVLKNPRFAFRSAFMILFEPTPGGLAGNQRTIYYQSSDTTRIANVFFTDFPRPNQLSLGFEKRGKKYNYRWSSFYGFDLVGAVYRRTYSLFDFRQKKLPGGEWVNTESPPEFGFQLGYKESYSWYAGVGVHCGFRYAFNKRWMMSFQSGADLRYVISNEYVRGPHGYNLLRKRDNYFDIASTGLVNDFSIVFRL